MVAKEKTRKSAALQGEGSQNEKSLIQLVALAHEERRRTTSTYDTQTSPATTSTTSSMAPTTEYSGSCKCAYKIRVKGPSSGLMRQMNVFVPNQIIFACKSSHCKFHIIATKTRNGYQIDDNVYEHGRHGLQYRLMFLAKSHVADKKNSEMPSFVCLICILLGSTSDIYLGRDELFSHILKHRERTLRGNTLEGPIKFGSRGVISHPEEFDISLPRLNPPPLAPNSGNGMSVVMPTELQHRVYDSNGDLEGSSYSTNSTEVTSSPDNSYHEENPWLKDKE